MENRLAGHTKHGELTLDDIAELQPRMSGYNRDGPSLPRFHVLHYVARDGNYERARFQLRGFRKTLRHAAKRRPKYTDVPERFWREYLDPIR